MGCSGLQIFRKSDAQLEKVQRKVDSFEKSERTDYVTSWA